MVAVKLSCLHLYNQHNDVSMSSTATSSTANIFMSNLEETLMYCSAQSGVYEWFRYVDGTFILKEPITHSQDVLNILNNFHPSINFTRKNDNELQIMKHRRLTCTELLIETLTPP